ncbi:MAG: pyridoxamine 5'-phosphate oxidase family protein [Candidatus Limnocylindria bacterium]
MAEQLIGMRLLTLATVTADGRPIAGPVDGIFFRGAFHFGSAPDSVRFRHIGARPQVSATHLPGEQLAVTVVVAHLRSTSMARSRRSPRPVAHVVEHVVERLGR